MSGLHDLHHGKDVVQLMPHAQGPEKSILSSMLKDPEQWIGRAVELGITRDHFYVPAHGTLFDLIRELNSAGKEIELVTLHQILHDRTILDTVGGPAGLTDIFTYAPNSAHFESHAAMVKDKYVLRRVIQATNEAQAAAYSNPEEVGALLDRAEASILAIRHGAEVGERFDAKRGVGGVFDWLQGMIAGEVDTRGIASGYKDLDRMAKGLKPGEVFVIAARPSMGKTSLMMNVVEHVCVDQGIPSLVFSCEMTAFQIMQRLVFARARFEAAKVERGFKPTKEELARLRIAGEQISDSQLLIDDTAGLTIDRLRAKARRRKREDGIGFIAVDYLQLVRSESRQAMNSREREIGEVSAGIKALAKELDLPILVLAQLNRGPEGRSGKALGVPRMSDLRESGTIEQDADMIGLLYRAAYYAENEEERAEMAGEAELVLAKNRNGETGHVPLTFLPSLMRFESRSQHTA